MLGKDRVEYARTRACCDANEAFKRVHAVTKVVRCQPKNDVLCVLSWLAGPPARPARKEQHQPSRLDRGLQPPLSVPALAATFVALCRSHDTAMDEFKVCSATAGQ